MQEITVETDLGERLGGLVRKVVLCDSTRRALGLFSPLPDRSRVEDLQLEPLISIAETDELRKAKTGKPVGHSMSHRVLVAACGAATVVHRRQLSPVSVGTMAER